MMPCLQYVFYSVLSLKKHRVYVKGHQNNLRHQEFYSAGISAPCCEITGSTTVDSYEVSPCRRSLLQTSKKRHFTCQGRWYPWHNLTSHFTKLNIKKCIQVSNIKLCKKFNPHETYHSHTETLQWRLTTHAMRYYLSIIMHLKTSGKCPFIHTCKSTSGPSPACMKRSDARMLLIFPFPSTSHVWKHSP